MHLEDPLKRILLALFRWQYDPLPDRDSGRASTLGPVPWYLLKASVFDGPNGPVTRRFDGALHELEAVGLIRQPDEARNYRFGQWVRDDGRIITVPAEFPSGRSVCEVKNGETWTTLVVTVDDEIVHAGDMANGSINDTHWQLTDSGLKAARELRAAMAMQSVSAHTANSEKGVWLWDLHPLAGDAWPNQRGITDASPGSTTQMRRLKPGYSSMNFLTSLLPAADLVSGKAWDYRDGYRPDADDLAALRASFPDRDPHQPSWPKIEARLVAGGRSKSDLVNLTAPTLVGLLDGQAGGAPVPTGEAGDDTSGRLPTADELRDDERRILLAIYRFEYDPYWHPDPDRGQQHPIAPVPDLLLSAAACDMAAGVPLAINTGRMAEMEKTGLIRRQDGRLLHDGQWKTTDRSIVATVDRIDQDADDPDAEPVTSWRMKVTVDGESIGSDQVKWRNATGDCWQLTEAGHRIARQLRQAESATGQPPATDSRAAPANGKPRKRPGRKPDTDFREDKRVWEAWQTKRYRTFLDLAKALGKTETDVKLAVDRHRKRQKK